MGVVYQLAKYAALLVSRPSVCSRLVPWDDDINQQWNKALELIETSKRKVCTVICDLIVFFLCISDITNSCWHVKPKPLHF